MAANRFVVGGYGESSTTQARYLTFAYPVRDDAGQPQGAVLAGVDLRWLADVVSRVALPDQAVLSVHDRDLVFLARVPAENGLIGRRPPPQVAALAALADKGAMDAVGADGRVRVGAIKSVRLGQDSEPDLSVAFGLSRDAAFAPIDAETRWSLALLVVSGLLAAAAAWFGGRKFIRDPVDSLLAAASHWARGDYKARVRLTDRSFEFGRLATAFEEMAEALGRRDAEQRLLINELNHRVKNTLATVQSMAAQTFRRVPDPEARANFEARLLALAKTHDILTRESWESASILDIVSASIEPYVGDSATAHFRVHGPAMRLPPNIVLPLSMALHELCTNAVKYGALSARSGYVEITWETDASTVQLKWVEAGGPPVRDPTRKGFGLRLLERTLAQQLGGVVNLRFALKGLRCEIEIPLPSSDITLASASG
jgi:two-component sensor histidine kinase